MKEGNEKLRSNAPPVIEMPLGHGDMVLMHSTRIQEYSEHAVDPIGKLMFALICRYIDPHSLKPKDRPSYLVRRDDRHYGSKLAPLGADC